MRKFDAVVGNAVLLQRPDQALRRGERTDFVAGPVGAQSRDRVPTDPHIGGNISDQAGIGMSLNHLRRNIVPGHNAEQTGGRLRALVQTVTGPILMAEAGRPHGLEDHLHWYGRGGRIPVGVEQGQAAPGRAAGHSHPVQVIPQLLRRRLDGGDAVPDLQGLGIDAGLRMSVVPQGIVDAGGYIALGAEPLQYARVVGFVAGGKAARVEIDHQTIALPSAIRRKIEVESVCLSVPIREIGADTPHRIIPSDGV